jgi:acetyltransferase
LDQSAAAPAVLSVAPDPCLGEKEKSMTRQTYPDAIAPSDLVTQSGVGLSVRAYDSADRLLLAEFFTHVGADDRLLLFPDTAGAFGSAQIAAFEAPGTTVFLAFASGGELAACATLERRGENAEVTVIVGDEYKQRGVGWTLLEDVLRRAKASGVRVVTATESGEERRAIDLEREMGFVARLQSADPVVLSLSKRLDD